MKLLFLLSILLPRFVSGESIQWVDDAVIEKARQAMVFVRHSENNGISGFFVSATGNVMTLAGPLEGLEQVDVYTSTGEVIRGCRLIALDQTTDLAILATGKKTSSFLSVRESPAKSGEPCALLYCTQPSDVAVTDGRLLARRESLNISQTSHLEYWSVGLNPNASLQLVGAPVITRDGMVAGIYEQLAWKGGKPPQRFSYALPEEAMRFVLAKAKETTGRVEFPQRGSVIRYGMVEDDADYAKGLQLISGGEPSAALERFRSALQRNPSNPVIMTRIGVCLEQMGDLKGAQKVLETAIQMAPERIGTRITLGTLLDEMGDSAKTIKYLEQLWSEFPKAVVIPSLLGKNMLKSGRKEEAMGVLKKATELMPDSMHAWTEYADALSAVGRTDDANEARNRANELESLFFKFKYSAPRRK